MGNDVFPNYLAWVYIKQKSKQATQAEEMSDKQSVTCVVLLPSDLPQAVIFLTHPSFFISACLAGRAFIFYVKGRVCSQSF